MGWVKDFLGNRPPAEWLRRRLTLILTRLVRPCFSASAVAFKALELGPTGAIEWLGAANVLGVWADRLSPRCRELPRQSDGGHVIISHPEAIRAILRRSAYG